MYMWGSNSDGQLGDGTTDSKSTPVLVASLDAINVSSIALGNAHSGALGEKKIEGIASWLH